MPYTVDCGMRKELEEEYVKSMSSDGRFTEDCGSYQSLKAEGRMKAEQREGV